MLLPCLRSAIFLQLGQVRSALPPGPPVGSDSSRRRAAPASPPCAWESAARPPSIVAAIGPARLSLRRQQPGRRRDYPQPGRSEGRAAGSTEPPARDPRARLGRLAASARERRRSPRPDLVAWGELVVRSEPRFRSAPPAAPPLSSIAKFAPPIKQLNAAAFVLAGPPRLALR